MPIQFDCPIWGVGHSATFVSGGYNFDQGELRIYEEALIASPRTCGQYMLEERAYMLMRARSLSNEIRARLTTWLIEQRMLGVANPTITYGIAYSFVETDERRSLSVAKRAERLLRFLTRQTKRVGEYVGIEKSGVDSYCALSWSESTDFEELIFLLQYLDAQGFIRNFGQSDTYCQMIVTVEGFGYLEEIITNPDSSQAFVAMWFDDSMDNAYENGIAKAITDAGFTPLRIDKEPKVNKIDDQIIAEIRRSRFLVADMTHGAKGARGGVYFEAGFALGLNIPVIYCCRDDDVSELHFDIRQYYHIFWKTHEELRTELKNRIISFVGEGPELSRSAESVP